MVKARADQVILEGQRSRLRRVQGESYERTRTTGPGAMHSSDPTELRPRVPYGDTTA